MNSNFLNCLRKEDMSVLSTLNFWFEGYCPVLLIVAIFDLLLLFFQLYVESQPREIKVT